MLQYLSVLLVARGPKPNTVFDMQPHQCQVKGMITSLESVSWNMKNYICLAVQITSVIWGVKYVMLLILEHWMVEYSNLQHLYTSKKSRAGTTDIRNGKKKKKYSCLGGLPQCSAVILCFIFERCWNTLRLGVCLGWKAGVNKVFCSGVSEPFVMEKN